MSVAPSYFEHVARQPELDVVEWVDPEEITVVERCLTDDEVERILRQLEAAE